MRNDNQKSYSSSKITQSSPFHFIVLLQIFSALKENKIIRKEKQQLLSIHSTMYAAQKQNKREE